jgi:hypothetical protein
LVQISGFAGVAYQYGDLVGGYFLQEKINDGTA